MNRRLIAACLTGVAVVAASLTSAFAAHPATSVQLTAAGSTFDAPLFSAVFPAYQRAHGVSVNYQALGSGTGQNDLNSKTVDFGCFDVPMLKSDHYSNFKQIVQFPVALGGVSMIYNLKGYHGKLKLTGSIIANIYAGKIKSWTDKALVRLNPGLKKAGRGATLTPVRRADSSGTSYAFTDFLSRTNAAWKKKYGASKSPNWPSGDPGEQHSSGVAGLVASTPGAIGYVESAYYVANRKAMAEAWVQSRDHTWLEPTLKTVTSDASHIGKLSATHFSIVYASGNNSYPISTFSWCGLFIHQSDRTRGKAAVALFKWEVTKGEEKYGPGLTYAKLPSGIQRFATSQLKRVKA